MTVIVLGDLIEDASVAAGVGLARHGATVDDGGDGRTATTGRLASLGDSARQAPDTDTSRFRDTRDARASGLARLTSEAWGVSTLPLGRSQASASAPGTPEAGLEALPPHGRLFRSEEMSSRSLFGTRISRGSERAASALPVGAQPGARQHLLDQLNALLQQRAIPAEAVLLGQRDERAIGALACAAARDRSALEAAMSDSRPSRPELPKPEHPHVFRRVIAFVVWSAHGGRSQSRRRTRWPVPAAGGCFCHDCDRALAVDPVAARGAKRSRTTGDAIGVEGSVRRSRRRRSAVGDDIGETYVTHRLRRARGNGDAGLSPRRRGRSIVMPATLCAGRATPGGRRSAAISPG